MTPAYDGRSLREAAAAAIARMAANQHGVISRAQALGCGLTPNGVDRRVRTRAWERLYPGVYRLAGAPETWRQSLLAACLAWGPGAAISHRSAAPLWRIPLFDAGPVELSVPRGRVRVHDHVVHRPMMLARVDVTIVDAIPVTTPARTLIDIASFAPADVVEVAFDDVLRRKLASLPRLRWRLRELGVRGRPGAALLSDLIDARFGDSAVPQNVFETRLAQVLRRARLPLPIAQHEIKVRGRLLGVVDFAFVDQRVAIEADGYRWHSGRIRWERDLVRRNALTASGWKVVHVSWRQLHDSPDDVVASIAAVLGRA